MIQTIRLLREKEDDIWALYIIEFLKLIGCVVTDVTLQEIKMDSNVPLPGRYDMNLCLNMKNEDERLNSVKQWREEEGDIRSFCFFFVPRLNSDDGLKSLRLTGQKILDHNMIDWVWKNSEDVVFLKEISHIYCQTDAFYYLYNKGSLKFAQEFYPLSGMKRDFNEAKRYAREKALKMTFLCFNHCYSKLLEKQLTLGKTGEYDRYAILKLKYKLNQMGKWIGAGPLFKTQTMLDEVECLRRQNPDFIRINYLGAKICVADSRYLADGEMYYGYAIEKVKELHSDAPVEDFLYYQVGKYFEKLRGDLKRAKKYYDLACQCNLRAYRSLYKIAQAYKADGETEEAIAKLNQIIELLLNGYQMHMVMPKQQIYLYKCFVLLGDIYFQDRVFDLAQICYQRAVEMSKAGSDFYNVLIPSADKKADCFSSVFSTCLPIQPVYMKLIGCFAQYRDYASIENYYTKLNEMEV